MKSILVCGLLFLVISEADALPPFTSSLLLERFIPLLVSLAKNPFLVELSQLLQQCVQAAGQ